MKNIIIIKAGVLKLKPNVRLLIIHLNILSQL